MWLALNESVAEPGRLAYNTHFKYFVTNQRLPMRLNLTLATAVLSAFIAGCATTASDPSFSHDAVPPKRVLFIPDTQPGQKPATVEVMRDSQFTGSAMTTTLTFDGQEMAHIQSGEKIVFRVPPGEHLLGLKYLGNDPLLGSLTLGLARPKRFIEAATRFESGKTYIFRIVGNANWEWDLKRSSY